MGWFAYEAGRLHMRRVSEQLDSLGALITTKFTSGTNNLKGIAYIGSRTFAVGGSNGEVCYFSDGGTTCSDKDADILAFWGSYQIADMDYSTLTGTLIAVGANGNIARKAAGGAFTQIANPFGTSEINRVRCDQLTGVWHACGETGKYARSIDDGATWGSLINIGFGTIECDNIYCGTGFTMVSGHSRRVNRSVDDGATWQGLISTPFDSGDAFWCIEGDGKDIVALGCYDTATSNRGKICISYDKGVTFENELISTPFTDVTQRPIRMKYVDNTWIMVGDAAVMCYSHNLKSWTRITDHSFPVATVYNTAYSTDDKQWMFTGSSRRCCLSGAATD